MRKLGGRFVPATRRHAWRPGEKDLFARRNDVRSIEATLAASRRRRVVDPAEVAKWEALHAEMVARLRGVEAEHGFAPDHETDADSVIRADRAVINDWLTGRSVVALSASLEAASRRAGITMLDEATGERVPKYVGAAAEVARIKELIRRQLDS